jgi:hypothetical protein
MAPDIEADGDLDLCWRRAPGAPVVLRNNGDGTWQGTLRFPGAKNTRGFAWADFDDDGDNDIALLNDEGALQVFSNERSGRFSVRTTPQTPGKILAMVPADVNGDGIIDIVVLQTDGAITRLTSAQDSDAWSLGQVARLSGTPSTQEAAVRACSLPISTTTAAWMSSLANGGKTQLFLADVNEKWQALRATLDTTVSGVGDLNGDGRLD